MQADLSEGKELSKKSIEQVLKETLNTAEEILNMKFDFLHETFDKHFEKVHKSIKKFRAQLLQLHKGLGFEELVIALETLTEHNLEINSKDQISEKILILFLEFVLKHLLHEVRDSVHRAKSKGPNQDLIDNLVIVSPKLDALIRFFPVIVKYDKADLFSLPDDHESWQKLKEYGKVVEIKNAEEMKKSFDKFLGIVYTGASMVKFGSRFKDNHIYVHNTMKYLSGAYYLMFRSHAKRTAQLFYSESTHDAFGIWSVMDGKYLMPFFELSFTSITTNELLYLPRQYPEITRKRVYEAYTNGVWKSVSEPLFKENETFPLHNAKTKGVTLDILKKQANDKIQIRVLSPDKLENKTGKTKYETLIIHLHGGGWVGMSTAMHQIYLRHWAKNLGVPVFSVDYRLAPAHPYPAALDDCWQFYNWMLDNCHLFGIDPKKVIVAGDSAGGNMAISLSILASKSNRRVPDGLVLAYPALSVQNNLFTPSYLKAVNDEVVPFTLLELCRDAYVKDYEHVDVDPILSPILHTDEFLKLLPPIKMMVGDTDPLHDDCWRFLHRLIKIGKHPELSVFKDLMHGCLNFDMIMGMPECNYAVKYCCEKIKELATLDTMDTKTDTPKIQ